MSAQQLIAQCDHALRPQEGTPRYTDSIVVHVREIGKMRHNTPSERVWDDSLWAYGEREYVHNGHVSYRSVAVKIEEFHFYVYFDASELSMEGIQFMIDHFNTNMKRFPSHPDPIVEWGTEMKRKFIGVDYEQYLRSKQGTPDERLHRRFVKLKLINPSAMYKLREICKNPIPDHRNIPRQITLFHTSWDWGNLFIHTNDLRLQTWWQFDRRQMIRMPDASKSTVCQEEYVYGFMPGTVTVHPTASGMPYLCATIRLRISSADAITTKEPHASIAAPITVEKDKLLSICSDIYWSGHNAKPVRVRLWVRNPYGAKEAYGQHEESNENTHLLVRQCQSPEKMLELWLKLMARWDPDAFITLHDSGNDVLHTLLRSPDNNISKFKELSVQVRPAKKPGTYYYSTPGRSVVNLGDYMKKMQVKPRFDAFTILAAYSHDGVYHGPKYESFPNHRPANATFQNGTQNLWECGTEASVLRFVEQGPAIMADAAALSNVCTIGLTRIISNGQQVRVLERLRHDCHRANMIINPDQLRIPVLELDSSEYNSFPEPPRLPNISLRRRQADFDQRWADAIANNPPHPDLRCVEIGEAPDPLSFPPTEVLDEPSNEQPDKPKKRAFNRFLFGTNAKPKKKKPKKQKYGGGFVQDPQPQFYEDRREMIATLDFASLYPSIIQAEGYCYSNLVWDKRVIDDPRFTKKYVEVFDGDSVAFVTHIDGIPVRTILPETERELVAERNRVKKLMKQAGAKVHECLETLSLPETTTADDVQRLMRQDGQDMDTLKSLAGAMIDYTNYEKQQLGSKVTQNALFGFTGVERNGIMPCVVIMAAITATGRWMIKLCSWYAIRYHKAAVVYGDSVSGETPLVLRKDGEFTLMTAEDLWGPTGASESGKQYKNLEGYETWTERGWTPVERIMRHKTKKMMFRVVTDTGIVDVTEDHSLLSSEGESIKPCLVQSGAYLMHKFPKWTTGTDKPDDMDELKRQGYYCAHSDGPVPDEILRGSKEVRMAFWSGFYNVMHKPEDDGSTVLLLTGQLRAASVNLLVRSLGFQCVLELTSYDRGAEYCLFIVRANKCRPSTGKVRDIIPLGYNDDYVYDLTTANHHFHAGVGDLIVHNTDSVMIQVPAVPVEDGPPETLEKRYVQAYWDRFDQVASEMSKLFPSPHDMELECMDWPFLLTDRKKNYAYQMWENPREPKKVKISGLPFIKRDRCNWVRTICTRAVKMIIGGRADELEPFMRTELDRLSQNKISLEDLAVSCSLKDRSDYKGDSDNLIQLQIANKIENRTGARPEAGSRITYLVTRGKGQKYHRGETIDYVRANKVPLDLHHYLNQIHPIMSLIFMHHQHVIDVERLVARCRSNIDRYYAMSNKRTLVSMFSRASGVTTAAAEAASNAPTNTVDELDVDFEEDSDDDFEYDDDDE